MQTFAIPKESENEDDDRRTRSQASCSTPIQHKEEYTQRIHRDLTSFNILPKWKIVYFITYKK